MTTYYRLKILDMLKNKVEFSEKDLNSLSVQKGSEKMETNLLKYIDNIEQLGADMRFKVNNDRYDLEIEIESIKEWLKDIERIIKPKESPKALFC